MILRPASAASTVFAVVSSATRMCRASTKGAVCATSVISASRTFSRSASVLKYARMSASLHASGAAHVREEIVLRFLNLSRFFRRVRRRCRRRRRERRRRRRDGALSPVSGLAVGTGEGVGETSGVGDWVGEGEGVGVCPAVAGIITEQLFDLRVDVGIADADVQRLCAFCRINSSSTIVLRTLLPNWSGT